MHTYLPDSAMKIRAKLLAEDPTVVQADLFHSYLYDVPYETPRDNIIDLVPRPSPPLPATIAGSKLTLVAPKRMVNPPPSIIDIPSPLYLTYGNLAVWLTRMMPYNPDTVVARRRRMGECVLQSYLDEHGGQKLPRALEPWAYTYKYVLNSQDPIKSLVTAREALQALRDPLVIHALSLNSVPEELAIA